MHKTLHYVYDPLCGWCYGAASTLQMLADNNDVKLQLLPSGLFSGAGARNMDDDFAAYAWSNDQRIEQLTGQRFSERYRQDVLANRLQLFDSHPATMALTAVALAEPTREVQALKAIQQARYVDGLDITRLETLAKVLRSLGLENAAAQLTQPDAALTDANNARIAQAQALLQPLGARGVPAFILEKNGQHQLLPSSAAFSHAQRFVEQVIAA